MTDRSGAIAFMADVHVGNHVQFGGAYERGINRRCRLVLDALKLAFDAIQNRGVRTVVIAGDLFESHRPSPQILDAVADIFTNFRGSVYLLKGNHDATSDAPYDNALAPLRHLRTGYGHVHVVDQPGVYVPPESASRLILVPYRVGPMNDALLGAMEDPVLDKPWTWKTFLAFHAGVRDARTPFYLQQADDSIDVRAVLNVMKMHRIEQAYAGNWHNARDWEDEGFAVHQIGALCPTGFDNPGGRTDYGRVLFSDGEEIFIPGPRFLAWSGDIGPPDEITELVKRECIPFVRIRCHPDDAADAEGWLFDAKASKLVEDGRIETVEPEPGSRKPVEEAARLEGLHAAVTRYVHDVLRLPEGVTKDEVLAACMRALGGV